MDLINDGILFKHIMEKLKARKERKREGMTVEETGKPHIAGDGNYIFVDDPDWAEGIAAFLEAIGFEDVENGYWGEKEECEKDEKEPLLQDWYYIEIQ